MSESKGKVVVTIPTYNEQQNIGSLIQEILALRIEPDLGVLVVDDNSPDGTAEAVADIGRRNSRVRLLLRKEKRGRGLAGIAGFREALDMGADFIIEMDGDGSHQPVFMPSLLEAAKDLDLVLGSRFIEGGEDADRSRYRRFVTFLVRHFIRRLFSVPVSDVSSGFRCFRREALEIVGLDSLVSTGPSIVLEVLYRAHRLGLRIGEIPIIFVDRKRGKTKLTGLTLWRTLLMAIRVKRIHGHVQPVGRT
jgi:dolichol-phosphate mannosyltransferase